VGFSRKDILAGLTCMPEGAFGNSKVHHGCVGKTYIGDFDGQISERVKDVASGQDLVLFFNYQELYGPELPIHF
jgi:hypothetical protein